MLAYGHVLTYRRDQPLQGGRPHRHTVCSGITTVASAGLEFHDLALTVWCSLKDHVICYVWPGKKCVILSIKNYISLLYLRGVNRFSYIFVTSFLTFLSSRLSSWNVSTNSGLRTMYYRIFRMTFYFLCLFHVKYICSWHHSASATHALLARTDVCVSQLVEL